VWRFAEEASPWFSPIVAVSCNMVATIFDPTT
jgi:hypothetical protein